MRSDAYWKSDPRFTFEITYTELTRTETSGVSAQCSTAVRNANQMVGKEKKNNKGKEQI